MKLTGLIAGAAALSTVFAYPGMGNMMGEIATLSKAKRDTPDPPAEMIGDLIKGNTTATGTLVKMCLNGEIDCYDDSNKVNAL
jgi:ABC-type dipeptide/oligopeptide/nickel transport system permease component